MDVLKEFLESTTIHGLAYISSAKVGVKLTARILSFLVKAHKIDSGKQM